MNDNLIKMRLMNLISFPNLVQPEEWGLESLIECMYRQFCLRIIDGIEEEINIDCNITDYLEDE